VGGGKGKEKTFLFIFVRPSSCADKLSLGGPHLPSTFGSIPTRHYTSLHPTTTNSNSKPEKENSRHNTSQQRRNIKKLPSSEERNSGPVLTLTHQKKKKREEKNIIKKTVLGFSILIFTAARSRCSSAQPFAQSRRRNHDAQ